MSASRAPALFIGHGTPLNAITDTPWSRAWRQLASLLPTPRAVVAVSAHWYVPGTFVTANERPETIHDFHGFPPELFAARYPAPGDPALARRVVRLLGEDRASLREDWGLDHGTWTVLAQLRPEADLPVVQLSLDHRLEPAAHVELGRRLRELREEGVMVLASGNIVHNLRHALTTTAAGRTETPAWAERFDDDVTRALEQHDGDWLVDTLESDRGRIAHPTPDHFLPLLYAAGAAHATDAVHFPVEGFDLGSLSMRAVLFE